MALALPVAFAACTNEEFENELLQENGRELLSKDFSIIASKTNAPESRGQWAQNVVDGAVKYDFNWVNKTAADKIGLCWTGVATAADGTDVSVVNPNNMALSNYEFVLTHYAYKDGNNTLYASYDAEKTAGFVDAAIRDNYENAKFAVTGVTPFTGQYVMYYPYSAALKNVGYLPVSVAASQTVADMDLDEQLAAFGNQTLCISEPYEFESDATAADVKLYPYTTGLLLRMFKVKGGADVNVKRIMLVAAEGKSIINEQTLDLAGTVKSSKGVNVITLTLPNGVNVNDYTEEGYPGTAVEALMAVLPQTLAFGEFELLFVNSASKAYSYPVTKDMVFSKGQLRAPNVTLDASKFTMDIISDDVALTAAVNAVTTEAKTISTYKNVPVEFANTTFFTNTKKATVNAEKITFNSSVSFAGDIEFTCPVEFKGSVVIQPGATVTLADGTIFNQATGNLVMNDKVGNKVATLNLNSTTFKASLNPTGNGAIINFVSGTSTLASTFTVGANVTLNVNSGAVLNATIADALVNDGTVNVVNGGSFIVAAPYNVGLTTITPSIANNAKLNVNGSLTNNSIVNNNGILKTEGTGLINNNKTINNTANIILMQSTGVAVNQIEGAAIEDAGNISGIKRISGGDIIITTDDLAAALVNPTYTNHTAFRSSTAGDLGSVNTTKKLILGAAFTFSGDKDHVTGAIEIIGAASIYTDNNKKLTVNGNVTIASGKSLTIGTATDIRITGQLINNGTFGMTNPANTYVECAGIAGTGTWNNYPQW